MEGSMRVLKAVTIGMGVLILVGTTVVIVTIARRMAARRRRPSGRDRAAPGRAGGDAHRRRSRRCGDRLAVQLQGGGADRVVLVDPRFGRGDGADQPGALTAARRRA